MSHPSFSIDQRVRVLGVLAGFRALDDAIIDASGETLCRLEHRQCDRTKVDGDHGLVLYSEGQREHLARADRTHPGATGRSYAALLRWPARRQMDRGATLD